MRTYSDWIGVHEPRVDTTPRVRTPLYGRDRWDDDDLVLDDPLDGMHYGPTSVLATLENSRSVCSPGRGGILYSPLHAQTGDLEENLLIFATAAQLDLRNLNRVRREFVPRIGRGEGLPRQQQL